MWKTISDIVQVTKNKKSGIKCILDKGNLVTNPAAIANKFKNFFINISPSLAQNIPRAWQNYDKYLTRNIFSILNSFHFKLVDDEIVS